MACYPFCKWEDLQTYVMACGSQATSLCCSVCGEVYEADATVLDLDDSRSAIEKRARLLMSSMHKIKKLEEELEDHLSHYLGSVGNPQAMHLTQPELDSFREMLAAWQTGRDVDFAQEEEDKKLSQSRRGRRMGQAFWTMPNPDRTDGKWK